MRLRLPNKVIYIIDILQRHGFEAYAVGGCVRDSVLAREPNDWDITTSARPEQVKGCFRRTVDTGIKHGTVTVMLEEDAFEVTTYRIDGIYSDGRHPDSVTFTPNLRDDLMRRDFTINAMAYNERDGLIDLYGGMQDLQKRIIRCVGNPDQRFDEDALRVMRAVRFAAQLGFTVEPATEAAAMRHAARLSMVSAERIRTELVKLLLSDHPEKMEDLFRLGISSVILPEFDRMMNTELHIPGVKTKDSIGHHTVRSLQEAPADSEVRLALLLHETGKPCVRQTDEFGWDHYPDYAAASTEIADMVLERLKFDNHTRKQVLNLISNHTLTPGTDAASVRKCMYTIGPQNFESYLAVRWADFAAGSPDREAEEKELRAINNLYARALQIRDHKDPLSVRDLKVNGNDLMEIGIKGKEIGEILAALLQEVLENPEMNEKQRLLLAAGSLKRSLNT